MLSKVAMVAKGGFLHENSISHDTNFSNGAYVMALVYHAREPSEWPDLQQAIEASVRTDEHRQEVFEMRRTIADELEERGAIRNRQQTLIRQLKRRFGDVPDELLSTIRATNAPEQLDEWLDRFATAETLDEVGIEVPA